MATIEELGRIPGVRVKEELDPSLGITSPQYRVIGLISTSFMDVTKVDIPVVRGSGKTDTIPGYDAAEVKEVLCVSPYMEAYGTKRIQYVKTTDYTVAENVITWVEGKNAPAEGDTYYVTATITKVGDSFFEPKEFTDYSQIQAEYGSEYDSTEDRLNQLVLLARFMFTAGAKRVVACQAKSNTLSDIQAALAKFEEMSVQYIVCGSNDVVGVNNAVMQHCVNMSTIENSMLRLAITGPQKSTGTVSDFLGEAQALLSQNITLVAPGEVQFNVEDQNGVTYTKWGNSIYAAAAIAGMLANPTRRLATPLTRKSLTDYGIYDVSSYFKKSDIEKMSATGITVLVKTKDTNVVKINQGLTTDNRNFASYYLNVVACKLEIARLLQKALDDTFIGTEITTGTPTSVANFLAGQLDGMEGIYINGYKNLSVKRDASIPTKLNAYVEVLAIFALDYLDLTFKVVQQ